MEFLFHGKFYTDSPDWVHTSRVLNEYELMIVDQGTLYIGNEENDYAVPEGEYLIMPPTAFQHGTRPGTCSFHWFHFICHEELPCPMRGSVKNEALLLSITNAIYQSEHFQHSNVSLHLFLALLDELSYENTPKEFTKKRPVKELVDGYLKYNQNHVHQVKELARSFGYHEKYLSQLFYRETGIHLKQYLTEYIMERGRELLLSTNLSIAAISSQCGFSEPHNFSRSIRHTYGMSPSQLRQNFKQH